MCGIEICFSAVKVTSKMCLVLSFIHIHHANFNEVKSQAIMVYFKH